MTMSNSPVGLGPLQLRRDILCEAGQVNRFAGKFGTRHTRQCQQIVNQAAHLLRGFAHKLQVTAALVIQLVSIILKQRQTEAIDSAQRRAQVMGNRIAERLKFAIGRLSLRPRVTQLFVHLDQPRIGVAITAQRHLERREGFCEEFRSLCDLGTAFLHGLAGDHRIDRIMMGDGDVEDANAIGERLAPELIGLIESNFVRAGQIAGKCLCISLLHIAGHRTHDGCPR